MKKTAVLIMLSICFSIVPFHQASSASTSCTKAGQLKKVAGSSYACVLKGKKLQWILVSGGSTNQNNSKPTISEADKLKDRGCNSLPGALVRLQNTTGALYNKAIVAVQEASFYIDNAARLDIKYEGLRNAQMIIGRYVQAVSWAGNGYSGDLNTVRTALATFNMGCNTNLTID
jgi:hypothetical protein